MKISICEQRVQEFRDRIPLRYIQKAYCAAWSNGEYCTCLFCSYEDRQYRHYQKIDRESYFGREDNSFIGQPIKMSTLPMTPMQANKVNRIGKIIPEGQLTVLTGLSGTGKSVSLLKFLNKHTIQPILFNMAHDFTLEHFDLSASSDNHDELIKFVFNRYTNINNSVIVLDDYEKCKEALAIDTLTKQERFVEHLRTVCSSRNCTIIVVADGKLRASGSTGIFKDNLPLIRECYEHLHINKEINKSTKPATVDYTLCINKGRGMGGFKGISNWMRK